MARDGDGLEVLRRARDSFVRGSLWHDRLSRALSDQSVGIHLGVFVEPYLEAILDGRKTIESRFGRNRNAPFARVSPGDVILLKRSGGPVVGVAMAGRTDYYLLVSATLSDLRRRFASRLFAEDDDFWSARADKRFATLIEIGDRIGITTLPVDKRDRRGWLTYRGRQLCLSLAA